MQRVCFTLQIRPGSETEYRRRHEALPGDFARAIRESGFRNHTLFRRGLEIVAYAECHPDAATAFAALAEREESARWRELMADVIVSATDERGERSLLEEVWHLDD